MTREIPFVIPVWILILPQIEITILSRIKNIRHISAASRFRIISQFIKKGWVTKYKNSENKCLYSLTKEGEKVADLCKQLISYF